MPQDDLYLQNKLMEQMLTKDINPFKANPAKRAKPINSRWHGDSLVSDGNVLMQAPSIGDAAQAINSFMPVTGDIQSGVMAANDVRKGDYGSAALNAVGLLPFLPSMAGVVKNKELQDLAKSHFGTTYRPQETGFILDDGTRLDFTGRHQAMGYEKQGDRYIPKSGEDDYLKNDRSADHRSVTEVIPNSQYGWDALSEFIDQTGAVRYMPETGVSMVHTNKPSEAQLAKIVNDYRVAGNPLFVDIDHAKHGSNLASEEFDNPTLKQLSDWINKQYGLLGGQQ